MSTVIFGNCDWWCPLPAELARSGLRVLIVDDHEVVHFGFRLMLARQLELERCIPARSAQEAIAMCRRYEPHIALVDLFVGEESGTDISLELAKEVPAPRVLFVSGAGSISASSARAAGGHGFVTKDRPARDIAAAITTIAGGGSAFAGQDRAPAVPLTGREREVLELLATGATNREIGVALHLSRYTVQDYARAVFRKLGVRNRTEAVQRAQRMGLLD